MYFLKPQDLKINNGMVSDNMTNKTVAKEIKRNNNPIING
jgi:hypothetical protein